MRKVIGISICSALVTVLACQAPPTPQGSPQAQHDTTAPDPEPVPNTTPLADVQPPYPAPTPSTLVDTDWDKTLANTAPYRGPKPRPAVATPTPVDNPNPAEPSPSEPTLPDETAIQDYLAFLDVVQRTEQMVSNQAAQQLAQAKNLSIINVTWEDTGRFEGSAVGPNISDMSIQVQSMDPRNEQTKLHLMPVIRYPNFTDKTGDIDIDRLYVLTGNEKGQDLEPVSLKELLGNLRAYLHDDQSWAGGHMSLLAERDTHVLVSAQACFLPIPRGGAVEFNPVLFNYQSYKDHPAVLTILVTPEGSSATIIDNVRDGFASGGTWGQRLFHNKNGQRALLKGERVSDLKVRSPLPQQNNGASQDNGNSAAGESGVNMVMLIQVPLVHEAELELEECEASVMAAAPMALAEGKSDTEDAAISSGRVEGSYTEIDNLAIERDTRFPIRVTVQFYKATSTGEVNPQDLDAISGQIERVYAEADYVGSLVVDGRVGRPTEHDGPRFETVDWWNTFWERHQRNTGMDRAQTLAMLSALFGPISYLNHEEVQRLVKDGILASGTVVEREGELLLATEHGEWALSADEALWAEVGKKVEAVLRPEPRKLFDVLLNTDTAPNAGRLAVKQWRSVSN
ncbi:MAG: hypothetical protein RBU37_08255 [Myxococcota bacterium]|jgi:hypothetical protein|nr:hypothetical protein [Myxococcota bacterium]